MIKLRYGILASLAVVGMVLTTACGSAPSTSKASNGQSKLTPVTIKLASAIPNGIIAADGVQKMVSEIQKNSGGKITVDAYLNGSLYNQTDLWNNLQDGSINIGVSGIDLFSNEEPATEVFDLPLLFNSVAQVQKATNGSMGKALTKIIAKQHVTVLGYLVYGEINTFGNSVRPITSPSDMKGLSFRSFSSLISAELKSYGASPVVIDPTEVYTSLQYHTIDGAFSSTASFLSQKWDEVIKYATIIPSSYAVYGVAANTQWWNSLTKAQQAVVLKAVKQQCAWIDNNVPAETQNDVSALQDTGVKVYVVPTSQFAEWKKPLTQVYNNYYSIAGAQGRQLVKLAEGK